MTFLDLCAGIGGFRSGLEKAGYKCVGFCEIDKFSQKSYRAMFNTKGEWFANDISKLTPEQVPYADIWCAGFPCQDISIAGKQKGIRGERSGVFFNIIKLIKGKKEKDKPTYIIFENVKNLLSINLGHDFLTVLFELDQAGYNLQWQVFNSKDYGVPQNRERVYIIGYLRSRGRREILPIRGNNKATLKQLIGGSQGQRVYNPAGLSCTLLSRSGGQGGKTGLYFIEQSKVKPKTTKVARCIVSRYNSGVVNRKSSNSGILEVKPILTPSRLYKRQNGRRIKNSNEPMFTLTTQDKHGVVIKEETKVKIRRLTPLECFRLQGFTDEQFYKAKAVNSDSQLYKQAGNAVTVNVAYAIALALDVNHTKK